MAGPLPITTGASSGLIPGWSPDRVTSSAIARSGFNLNAEVSVFKQFSYSLDGFNDEERNDYAIMFIPVFEAREFKINFESDVQFGSFGNVNYNGKSYNGVKNNETNIETLSISVKFASNIDVTKPVPRVVGGYIFKGYKIVYNDDDQ